MKPPEEVKTEFTREWVQKAEDDYRTARRLLESGEDYVDGTTSHAQQAAEKYIKALLVWRQIEFAKTHDIEVLLEDAAAADSQLSELLADAASLTPYGVEYRYPGDYVDVTVDDAESSYRLATMVRTEIRNRLPDRVLE